MDKPTIDTIPKDALITISVSGSFYARLQQCLFKHLHEKEHEPEVLTQILKELETRPPENLWEECVVILLALLLEIDESAHKQKVIVKEDISTFGATGTTPEVSPES